MGVVYRTKEHLISSAIKGDDTVLDVGFWGQGVCIGDANWPHNILKRHARDVYAFDLDFDDAKVAPKDHYFKASAEGFSISKKFDAIFAGDLIEHLSNPGLFLQASKKHLAPGGRLIVTTPNTFNLFNLTEKITKEEPTVNSDHSCYFNKRTLKQLFAKNGLRIESVDYVYTLGYKHKESWKKKFLNAVYWTLSKFTNKFVETVVVTATADRAV